MSKLIRIVPICDQDTIEFCWIVDYMGKNKHIKPEEYL